MPISCPPCAWAWAWAAPRERGASHSHDTSGEKTQRTPGEKTAEFDPQPSLTTWPGAGPAAHGQASLTPWGTSLSFWTRAISCPPPTGPSLPVPTPGQGCSKEPECGWASTISQASRCSPTPPAPGPAPALTPRPPPPPQHPPQHSGKRKGASPSPTKPCKGPHRLPSPKAQLPPRLPSLGLSTCRPCSGPSQKPPGPYGAGFPWGHPHGWDSVSVCVICFASAFCLSMSRRNTSSRRAAPGRGCPCGSASAQHAT